MGRIGGINTDPDWGGANIPTREKHKKCKKCGKATPELNYAGRCSNCENSIWSTRREV